MIKVINTLNMWNYFSEFPLSSLCVDSWKKFGNGATIKIWTENDSWIQSEIDKSEFCQFVLHNNDLPEFRKRLAICDFLKHDIMFSFGGAFFDADIELQSDFNFEKSFSLSYPANLSLGNPTYIDHANDSLFLENMNLYNNVEKSSKMLFISDWEMSKIENFSAENQQKMIELSQAGIQNPILYNHWANLILNNGKPQLWSVDIGNMIYFSKQSDFDVFLQKNMLKDIFAKSISPKFDLLFIDETITSPFLNSTCFNIKITKGNIDNIRKYLTYYLGTTEFLNEM